MSTGRAEPTQRLPVRPQGGSDQAVLVLGTAQLGGPYGITNVTGTPDDRAAARLLRAAADLGVTHLDTARAYGQSEQRIGTLLRSAGGPALRLITKVAPLEPTPTRDAAAVRAAVERSVNRSVAELDAAAPPTVLLHRARDADAAGGAGWERLREYAAAGITDRIGVSVQSPAELRAVIGLPDLGYLQLPCNVLDRRWLTDDVTGLLAGHPDVVVTARSIYLQGLLATGGSVRWPYLDDERRDRVLLTLDRLATELGRAGRTDLCAAYVLSLPWVTSVVVGMETGPQLRANVQLATAAPLTAAERARVLDALPAVPVDLLDPSRWAAAWRT
jgi:aryl-alcohol dehydrogenase-like predicted oxidoreductase